MLCFRFTFAVRSAFTYNGAENIAFAGGEELYVVINSVIVLKLFHDPSNVTVPCKMIDLSPAKSQGIDSLIECYCLMIELPSNYMIGN